MQLELFHGVLKTYLDTPNLSNAALYEQLVDGGLLSRHELTERAPIGRSAQHHSPAKRRVRWIQQTLRSMGLLERMPEHRGVWKATTKAKTELTPAAPKVVMLGFSTEWGIGLWGNAEDVFARIDEPISLAISSPPYPLNQPRAYGGPTADQYSDWICKLLEPIVKNLVPGGVVALNVSNDIFVQGSPERSTYREEMVIALNKRLGLKLMDQIIWHNKNKPPGPVAWASKERMQLGVAWEPVYWFCNEPRLCIADNRRVLQPHTEAHKKLLARGGETRTASNADGAYRIKPGSYGKQTDGRILRNLIDVSHNCPSQRDLRKVTDELGLPRHGAVMPLKLAQMLVEFFCPPGGLIAIPCAGTFTLPLAAELSQRRWVGTDKHLEYVHVGSHRFPDRVMTV